MRIHFEEREKPIAVSFSERTPVIDVDIEPGGGGGGTPYHGRYEVTPSEEAQTLPTAHTVLAADVVINPVPDNYARMQWNGSTILFY